MPQLRVMRILWGAFLASQAVFLVVAFIAPKPTGGPPGSIMVVALGATALAVAVASFAVPRFLRRQGLRALKLEVSSEVADQARFEGFYRDAPERACFFAQPEQALRRALPVFQTSFILSSALSEAVSLFGLTLAMMGFGPAVFVAFIAVGAILVAIRFPTESSLRSALAETYGAQWPERANEGIEPGPR